MSKAVPEPAGNCRAAPYLVAASASEWTSFDPAIHSLALAATNSFRQILVLSDLGPWCSRRGEHRDRKGDVVSLRSLRLENALFACHAISRRLPAARPPPELAASCPAFFSLFRSFCLSRSPVPLPPSSSRIMMRARFLRTRCPIHWC